MLKTKWRRGTLFSRIKTLHTGSHQLGGARKEYELLVANYDLKPGDLYVEKRFEALPSDAEGWSTKPRATY